MPRAAVPPITLAVAFAFAAAGCGGEATSEATTTAAAQPATLPAAEASCLEPRERRNVVRFHSPADASIAAVVLGHGPTGIVLAHETVSNLCLWMPYGRVLAKRGYRVLALDLNGYGASTISPGSPGNPRWDLDLGAGTKVLRSLGSKQVVLIGASLGGTVAVVAASRIRPPVAGVVDLSGPAQLSGLDDIAAARKLAVPALFVVARGDEFSTDVEKVYAADRHGDRRLELVPGGSHGVNLLDPAREPRASRIRRLVEGFIDAHK
jgi:pimeloyl-ACP methyl ester carboxylesterase